MGKGHSFIENFITLSSLPMPEVEAIRKRAKRLDKTTSLDGNGAFHCFIGLH